MTGLLAVPILCLESVKIDTTGTLGRKWPTGWIFETNRTDNEIVLRIKI
jgi:hypothetical protein